VYTSTLLLALLWQIGAQATAAALYHYTGELGQVDAVCCLVAWPLVLVTLAVARWTS